MWRVGAARAADPYYRPDRRPGPRSPPAGRRRSRGRRRTEPCRALASCDQCGKRSSGRTLSMVARGAGMSQVTRNTAPPAMTAAIRKRTSLEILFIPAPGFRPLVPTPALAGSSGVFARRAPPARERVLSLGPPSLSSEAGSSESGPSEAGPSEAGHPRPRVRGLTTVECVYARFRSWQYFGSVPAPIAAFNGRSRAANRTC